MYEESWHSLIWRREGWESLIAVFEDLKEISREDRARLFSRVPSDNMTGHSHKLQQEELQLIYRKQFLEVRGVK